MSRILIVEDDRKIAQLESDYLESNGYETKIIEDGKKALSELKTNHYDLILLDLMLPGCSGYDICRKIRDEIDIPILMVTARTEGVDVIRGLGLGADDYITKPFDPSELVARVDAVYRRVSLSVARPPEDEGRTLISGPFSINTKSRIFTKNGTGIEITQVEYQLLEYFMENSGSALDRRSILTHIWGNDYYGDDKIVDVNIRRLRMKIEEDPSNPRYITTIWGYGYKWCVDELAAAGEFSR